MAVYEINGMEFEVDDSIQGDALVSKLKAVRDAVGGSPPEAPEAQKTSGLAAPEIDPTTDQLPGGDVPFAPKPNVPFGGKVIGALETGASLGTALTSGALSSALGALYGLGDAALQGKIGTPEGAQMVQQQMEATGALGTYIPRTQTGQQYTAAAGEALAPLQALPFPGTAGPAGALGSAAQAARLTSARARVPGATMDSFLEQTGRDVVRGIADPDVLRNLVGDPVYQAVTGRARRIGARVIRPWSQRSGEDGALSVGAAQLSEAQRRAEAGLNLPVPIRYTKGQRERSNFEQNQFEREIAKTPLGEPLRKHFEEENLLIQQNIEKMLDDSDAVNFDRIEIGSVIDKTLRDKYNRDKAAVDKLYDKARASGGLEENVNLSPLATYLNENRAARSEASIMTKVQRQLDVINKSQGDFTDGSLQLKDMTLNDAESIMRFINKNVNENDRQDLRVASEIKRLINEVTDGVGNADYRAARKARTKLATTFEDHALINDLLRNKRGTDERAVALESVLDRVVFSPKTDVASLERFKSLILRKKERAGSRSRNLGEQTWKDLQAGVLQYIEDEMTKNVARDGAGNAIVSPAALNKIVTKLDKDGKLDIIFDGQTANNLRLLNDTSIDVLTHAPGVVNTSNTSSALINYFDTAAAAATGIPLPVGATTKKALDAVIRRLKSGIKDRAIRKRVEEALKPYEPPSSAVDTINSSLGGQ